MTTRRDFLTMSAGVLAGVTLGARRAAAAPATMTIARESSFIKAFDDYFSRTLLPEYEKMTGIKMSYEAVSVGGVLTRLTTIAETKSGSEITMTGLNHPPLRREPGLKPQRLVQQRRADRVEKIGRKTKTYVSNIFKYYLAYPMIGEERAERQKVKDELKATGK